MEKETTKSPQGGLMSHLGESESGGGMMHMGGGSLQSGINNSSQMLQFKALQNGINKSPQVQHAKQLQSQIGGGKPIQRKKGEVATYVKDNPYFFAGLNIQDWTKEAVLELVTNSSIILKARKGVWKAWNQGLKSDDKDYIPKPKELKVRKNLSLTKDEVLDSDVSDSDQFNEASYYSTIRAQLGKNSIDIHLADGEFSKKVPVFENFVAGAKLVRLWWKAWKKEHSDVMEESPLIEKEVEQKEGESKEEKIEKKETKSSKSSEKEPLQEVKLTGPQFAVKVGDRYGLYSKTFMEDLFFSNLKPVLGKDEQPIPGKFMRQAGLCNYDEYGKSLSKGKEEDSEIIQELYELVKGGENVSSELVMEIAGAMSCDGKHSLLGYKKVLDELGLNLDKEPKDLFYRTPKTKQTPIYGFGEKGGRSIGIEIGNDSRMEKFKKKKKETPSIDEKGLEKREKSTGEDPIEIIDEVKKKLKTDSEGQVNLLGEKEKKVEDKF